MALSPPLVVLFIEDDVQVRQVLCDWLRTWAGASMRCVEASTIAQGCEALQAGGIDLIILDWGLAGRSTGTGLATILDCLSVPERCTIPIEVISGDISDDEGLKAIESGAYDYWNKGTQHHAFLAKVQRSWARAQVLKRFVAALIDEADEEPTRGP